MLSRQNEGWNRYQNPEIEGKLGREGFLLKAVIFFKKSDHHVTSITTLYRGSQKNKKLPLSFLPVIDLPLVFSTGYIHLEEKGQGSPEAFTIGPLSRAQSILGKVGDGSPARQTGDI